MRGLFFYIIGSLYVIAGTGTAFAAEVNLEAISFPTAGNPALFVMQLYQFSLGAAAVVALGVIVFAAIEYATSLGNPARISDAKSRIFNAIWGLVLLFGAYLILNTINPELVVLREPELQPVTRRELAEFSCNASIPEGLSEQELLDLLKACDAIQNQGASFQTSESGALSREEACRLMYGGPTTVTTEAISPLPFLPSSGSTGVTISDPRCQ